MGGHRGRGRQLPAQLGHLALALGLVTQGPPPRTHSASQTHKYNPTLLHDILPGTFFKKANLISLIHILYHALTQSVQFNTNIVTDMRNHHHNQFTSKRDLHPLQPSLPISPTSSQPTSLPSVSTDLPLLDIAYKCSYTIRGLVCLASFPEQHVFKAHPWCSRCRHFIPFYG